MSPCLPTARPVWVWSFPALAVILSFLWYRKKRGSLKTDSGGAGEAQKDLMNVESEEEVTAPIKNFEVESVLIESEESRLEVIEIIDQVKINTANVEAVFRLEPELEPKPEAETEPELKPKPEAEPEIESETESKPEPEIEPETETESKPEPEIEPETETESKPEAKPEPEPKSEAVPEAELAVEENLYVEKEEKSEKENTPVRDTEIIKTVEESAISQKPDIKPLRNKCGKNKKYIDMAKKLNETKSSPDQRKSTEESAACILEQKLAKLDLENQHSHDGSEEKQTNDDVTERDSANNSPSEVMLASPSVSGYSDTHSEGSSDSGKGCSEMLTPSRTPASGNSVSGDLPVTSIYEFVIPQQLVGRLIGRHGSYVNEIKETTHASIYIKRHPDTPKLKICAVEGSQMDIDSALEMIRKKFPKKRYPNVSLDQVVISPEPQIIPIISEQMQLYLIEGINNDVILSSLVSAGHFFLQQPTHPTYLSLSRLNQCMVYCYSEPDQPTLPEGVGAGILCAAPVYNGWYRAQIVSMDAENNLCDVKFVDYGGYMTMPVSSLRQIRVDFVNLPFQASECYLAGVKPVNEENAWCEKAKELVEKLTFGKVLQAQVYGYAEDSVPLIYLYTVVDDEVILINQELVDRGFAEWLYSEPVTEEVQEMGGSDFEESGPVAVTV